MAEFQEVIKQWSRMCNGHCCDNRDGAEGMPICPIIERHSGWPCDSSITDLSLADVAMVEEIVMKWAAEHAESVYPTWMEWLADVGAIPKAISWDEPLLEAVYYAIQEPIPADIAQKLGIESKEGE